MRWLHNVLRRWLLSSYGHEVRTTRPASNLWAATSDDNAASISVTPIRNGFLLSRRVVSHTGPDKIEVVHAATVDDLTKLLIAEFAVMRFTK